MLHLIVIFAAVLISAPTLTRGSAATPPPRFLTPPAAREILDIQDSSLTYGPYGQVWRVPMQQREIALTFDDGPYPFYTPLLLHVLERSSVPATFFIVGRS